ncbi:squalene/phytoene synthase family protein [Jeotgalibacillus soli]|uniref:Phytoene synthase n=1 Tax=Jeotgalibacillus soli TaxID=889306 RepID=A0A0C2VJW9_9BACL|nr:phytoene/squalene synthase family protein [Jeotgalibacillus soli]KIL44293.1 hypothetical protein KP78_32570 [Jeotgalibacillus soli]
MNEDKIIHSEAMDMLMETSRTFFIPISYLETGLKETIASAYLCMRAIDEIEDHVEVEPEIKSALLKSVSELLRKPFDNNAYLSLIQPYKDILPPVTQRLDEWISLCPSEIVEKVKEKTAIMADGMAEWVTKEWEIKSKQDLDEYTYYVAGLVGVMLSDIWEWYDNIDSDKDLAVSFGRGLQLVNILRNRQEDLERGVDFFPNGWTMDDMFAYAKENLASAHKYIEDINNSTVVAFCSIPLALADSTIDALEKGREKISRAEVTELVSQVRRGLS